MPSHSYALGPALGPIPKSLARSLSTHRFGYNVIPCLVFWLARSRPRQPILSSRTHVALDRIIGPFQVARPCVHASLSDYAEGLAATQCCGGDETKEKSSSLTLFTIIINITIIIQCNVTKWFLVESNRPEFRPGLDDDDPQHLVRRQWLQHSCRKSHTYTRMHQGNLNIVKESTWLWNDRENVGVTNPIPELS